MQVHDLAPSPGSTKNRKRVGRGTGGKGGKTAGRGTKGQRARNTVARGFEGGQMPLKQRVPKLKGFNNPFRVEYAAVNLDTLEELADRFEGGAVTPESLVAAGASWPSRCTPCRSRPRRRSPPPAAPSRSCRCRSRARTRPAVRPPRAISSRTDRFR